jgi:hypothetical protein
MPDAKMQLQQTPPKRVMVVLTLKILTSNPATCRRNIGEILFQLVQR